MEEDLVDTHHNVIQTMQTWVQDDSQLISMTQEVDYDQDGKFDRPPHNLGNVKNPGFFQNPKYGCYLHRSIVNSFKNKKI